MALARGGTPNAAPLPLLVTLAVAARPQIPPNQNLSRNSQQLFKPPTGRKQSTMPTLTGPSNSSSQQGCVEWMNQEVKQKNKNASILKKRGSNWVTSLPEIGRVINKLKRVLQNSKIGVLVLLPFAIHLLCILFITFWKQILRSTERDL